MTQPPPIQPHLCVKGGNEAIAFYEKAFGATCAMKNMAEDGKRVFHAVLATRSAVCGRSTRRSIPPEVTP